MGALRTFAAALVMGTVISVPPGPAGVIILNQSLRRRRLQAARALAALLGAELCALGVVLAFFSRVAAIAAAPWLRPAAGLFLMAFAASAWRSIGSERGYQDTSAPAVFRITILNPAIWMGAVSTITIASTQLGDDLLRRVLFVAGMELGAVVWYGVVILAAERVPLAWQRRLERVAVLVIFAIGLWFAASYFAPAGR